MLKPTLERLSFEVKVDPSFTFRAASPGKPLFFFRGQFARGGEEEGNQKREK
jgi:hypothetical protein